MPTSAELAKEYLRLRAERMALEKKADEVKMLERHQCPEVIVGVIHHRKG